MPFRFKSSACVAVGTFNIYIVQPMWLAKREIIPKGIPVAIGTKIDEPGFRFSSPKMRSKWTVTPLRIEVSSKEPDEDCGEPVSKVLTFLRWTPLKAIGTNAVYEAPLSELELLGKFRGFYPSPPDGFSDVQQSFHVAVKQGEHVFNLQLSVTEEGIELATNVHTDIENRDSEVAQQAASKFLDHRRMTEQLARDLFKVDIDHASPNSPAE